MGQANYPYQPDTVTPPGYTLKEILEVKGMTQAELAERMNRPTKTISEIANAKTQITSETAIQLENVLGVPAEFWLNRESRFQEFRAKHKELEELEKQVPKLEDLPMRDLRKREFVSKTRDKVTQVKETIKFYGVNNLSQVVDIYFGGRRYQFRKSDSYTLKKEHLAAWIIEGKVRADKINTRPYNESLFKETLKDIRHLSLESPSVFEPKIRNLCSEAGVAFVMVPQYQKCRTSGLARWLRPDKALIQLSLRYKTDDHFWFSFFHEAAHILKHSKKDTFLDDYKSSTKVSDIEQEANEYAAEFLISSKNFEQLKNTPNLSKDDVRAFANAIGIAPGIVVGRLQHDGVIPYNWMNGLKATFEWTQK
jgi:addiction module HigA family antidote